MFLHQLKLISFKNYQIEQFEFHTSVNFLVGLNGSGKTNVLDAIYLLGLTKSFLGLTDAELVKRGEDFYRLEAVLKDGNEQHFLNMSYQKGGRKKIELDKDKRGLLRDYIGFLPVVIIAPNDSDLINGSSESRRKLLDVMISQYSPEYLSVLAAYQKILEQRNKLLRNALDDGLSPDKGLLEVYDVQLDKSASIIYRYRMQAVQQLKEAFNALKNGLLDALDEDLDFELKSHLHEGDLKIHLQKTFGRDQVLGYTSRGCHKDDLIFTKDKNIAKKFASQGQQKSLLICLKLAMAQCLNEKKNTRAIVLVDDIFDKLDLNRSKNLLKILTHWQGQVFITHTNIKHIEQLIHDMPNNSFKMFSIEDAKMKLHER